jgi:hypothetical protein
MSSMTKTKKVSVGLWLDECELEALREKATADGRSLSSYIRRLFFAEGCITTPANKAQKTPMKKARKVA